MASGCTVKWDPDRDRKLAHMPAVKGELTKEANGIAMRANAMGSAFRTEKTVDYETGEHVGGTAPRYEADKAQEFGDSSVAIAYTGNYSAMKHNHLHNALLKSIR